MDALNNLKIKVINDFNYLLKKLEKGYKVDYSIIMNEICSIDLHCNLKNSNYIISQLSHEYISNS